MTGKYDTTDAQERLTIHDASATSQHHVMLRLAGDLDSLALSAVSPAIRQALDSTGLYPRLPLITEPDHVAPQPGEPPIEG
ncbi:hypothetical protein GCM10010252_27490 [Streptomyces aureoverticillatus]|nr:hypothetical protein GCM10010252_27490 [Streptomyces aureoverticillatus]